MKYAIYYQFINEKTRILHASNKSQNIVLVFCFSFAQKQKALLLMYLVLAIIRVSQDVGQGFFGTGPGDAEHPPT